MEKLSKHIIAILCGGTGPRLWPLSRADNPKQFISIFSSKSILRDTWENAAKIALNHINEITENDIEVHKRIIKKSPTESVRYSFHNCARVDISGPCDQEYTIKFIDNDNQQLIHQDTIETYHYVKTNRMYYTNWKVVIEVNEELYSAHIFNPYRKRIIITLDSSSWRYDMLDAVC